LQVVRATTTTTPWTAWTRSADKKRINAIIFHFPKKNRSGQAIVSSDEKELKFVNRAGTIEIKASFDVQKMVDQQGMDL